MPPFCRLTSAIRGFQTTIVVARTGSLTSLAWSTLTAMASDAGSADTTAGHSNAASANPNKGRVRLRKELNTILNPGALTSRQKRYAAEPAPDTWDCGVN